MTTEQKLGQSHALEKFEKQRSYKCPDCGGKATYMGLDFKAPKMSDLVGWNYAQLFIESGKLFHRGVDKNF
jgi:hypothetical protein